MIHKISVLSYVAAVMGGVIALIGIKGLYSILFVSDATTREGFKKNRITTFYLALDSVVSILFGPIWGSIYFMKYSNIMIRNMLFLNDLVMIGLPIFSILKLSRNSIKGKYGVESQ